VASKEEIARKRKLPVYILLIVGIFLIALLVFMIAKNKSSTVDRRTKENCDCSATSFR
jgi:uncharacterized integral membrane protein